MTQRPTLLIQDGFTALHIAVCKNRPAVIDVLTAKGADWNLQDNVIPTTPCQPVMNTAFSRVAVSQFGRRPGEYELKKGRKNNYSTFEDGQTMLKAVAMRDTAALGPRDARPSMSESEFEYDPPSELFPDQKRSQRPGPNPGNNKSPGRAPEGEDNTDSANVTEMSDEQSHASRPPGGNGATEATGKEGAEKSGGDIQSDGTKQPKREEGEDAAPKGSEGGQQEDGAATAEGGGDTVAEPKPVEPT